jgi:hypothetical protein
MHSIPIQKFTPAARPSGNKTHQPIDLSFIPYARRRPRDHPTHGTIVIVIATSIAPQSKDLVVHFHRGDKASLAVSTRDDDDRSQQCQFHRYASSYPGAPPRDQRDLVME